MYTVDKDLVRKLLTALNECTEWGQIYIMDSIADYMPVDSMECESILERILPRI